jgi:transposase
VISVDDWAEIRHLSKVEGLSGREIARRLGIARDTVAKALASKRPPVYGRKPAGSIVDPFIPAIRALLVKDPGLKATVLAERVGFNNGVCTTVFRGRVREVKLELGVVDPADRLVFVPGEQAQCDLWFPSLPILATGVVHPVLTMIACWSRFLLAVMIPTRTCGDILAGMNVLLSRLGGLPERLLWDNETGIVSHHQLIPQAAAWAGAMGASVKLAKPRDPETKGRVERANGYLGTSFEPARCFTDILDFNTQLDSWLAVTANRRLVRAIGARPVDLLDDERMAMTGLPAPMPEAVIESRIRLARDYHVRIAGSDYSVDPVAIGRFVTVKASLDTVWATCDQHLVAHHARSLVPHQVVTDPAHVKTAARLRAEFQDQARRAANRPATRLTLVEQRDLRVYDQLWNQEAA